MPQLASTLPCIGRTNLDPPDTTTSKGLLATPDDMSSGGIFPDGTMSCSGSSLKKDVMKVTKTSSPTTKKLDLLIAEGESDVEDWKKMGLLDDDKEMTDTKESKKRERSYADEEGTSNATDVGELLAPFPWVSNPVDFV
jgi:hypothetical protein